MKPRETPSQKIVDPDLSAHSRQNDSRTFNDPDVMAAIHRENQDKIHLHIPIFHTHSDQEPYTTKPAPNTLEHYESIATGPIKEKMDEFKARRERLEREMAEDRRRTAMNYDYDEGGGGFIHTVVPVLLGLVLCIVFTVIFLGPILGMATSSITSHTTVNATISSPASINSTVDCTTLSGNAGPHQTLENASGLAKTCMVNNVTQSMLQLPIMLFPVVIIAMILLFVVRLL